MHLHALVHHGLLIHLVWRRLHRRIIHRLLWHEHGWSIVAIQHGKVVVQILLMLLNQLQLLCCYTLGIVGDIVVVVCLWVWYAIAAGANRL